MSGDEKQIETAREMIKEVMNQVCQLISAFLLSKLKWMLFILIFNCSIVAESMSTDN